MKKLFALLTLAFCFAIVSPVTVWAQETEEGTEEGNETDEGTNEDEEDEPTETEQEDIIVDDEGENPKVSEQSFQQVIKTYFIDGGPFFMSFVVICLILGLAVALERIITLVLSITNTRKLVNDVEAAMKSGGVEAAKDVARNRRGPVASIFVQGLMRASEGIEAVEKTVISYGSVEMGKLERGVTWLALFIALAPMLGFMGTVIGMIDAFDKIEAAGDIQPSLVAAGIKVALITTVSGLIVAIILQILYNFIMSMIDGLVVKMEESSIELVDIIVEHKTTQSTL